MNNPDASPRPQPDLAERAEIVGRADESLPGWAELAAEMVESLSRIMRAEIRVAESAARETIGLEVDRILKALIALVLISLGAICGLVGILFLLQVAFGAWWPGLLIVAGVMLAAGILLFMLGPRRAGQNSPARTLSAGNR